MLRILGIIFILVGLMLTISIVAAPIGIGLMLLGLLFIVVGRKRTVVVHVHDGAPK